jgi:adenine C2-methylase RlmN of 23S rRNA A2503 and tRNA A37
MLHPQGLALSPRRITLSTVGIPRGIHKLAASGLEVRPALSLHAPDDDTRRQIIPTALRYNIAEIMEAVRHYHAQDQAPHYPGIHHAPKVSTTTSGRPTLWPPSSRVSVPT